GKTFYGTQLSRPAWDAEFAELWEVDADGANVVRLASWDAAPISLAQDSVSGDVTTTLVDVGAGKKESDYKDKDVKGRLVLTSSQPGAVAHLAVGQFGAAGIISYAQNQKTAWWGEDENLVRWGHLETFTPDNERTFAFMVSLKTARALQQRLASGESVRMHAIVRAGQHAGSYDIATATIRGTELPDEEIVFSCHLDHPRPGANDNASGCATILEVARTLSKLIAEKRLAPPRRTIRFVWPPEVEGTLTLLNGRPQLASRIRAAVHLDMVGGGPETKAIFHVTRGPASNPSFVYDIADAAGDLVNAESGALAMTGTARWPMVAASGSKDPLRAEHVAFTEGSDHEVYSDSSWGIPAIYLNDWPDRYIHTNGDVAANIDATKLGRAGFIAAASGYALARFTKDDIPMLRALSEPYALERRAAAMRKGTMKFADWYESRLRASIDEFFAPIKFPVTARNPKIKGTMGAFGYDYFAGHYANAKDIKLDAEKRYEALNFADGHRSAADIAEMLTAIYGPTSAEDVAQYLAALQSIGVILPSGSAP
ncbi:MAG TPA: DUF4910 domain-containing protein, partial [Thermoanaerobaculia bacterium]|nr:DUF4910 domain-containing protein [Thermoanaerobaculia bacterium]